MTTITELIDRLERSYDAIPWVGGARVESVGPFELFLRDGPGWPYYARPRLGTTTVTAADVEAVLARQRALGVPLAIEWVHEVTPALLAAVESSGIAVLRAPLMVLDPARLPATASLTDAQVILLDPDLPDFPSRFAQSSAVARVAFGYGGTGIGPAGTAEREAAVATTEPELLALIAEGLRAGHKAEGVAFTPEEGVVARGAFQSALGAAEIVGVATLPAARRRGLGAAVSAALARHALAHGYDLVFLSAASEDVARVYARIGFNRVGTACIAEAS